MGSHRHRGPEPMQASPCRGTELRARRPARLPGRRNRHPDRLGRRPDPRRGGLPGRQGSHRRRGAARFSSLGENLASSYPTTQGWAVDVNNTTTADGLYDLYAVCANPQGYFVYGYGPFVSHAGHGGAADDGCGRNMKVLGGGARSNTTEARRQPPAELPAARGPGELDAGPVADRDDQPHLAGPQLRRVRHLREDQAHLPGGQGHRLRRPCRDRGEQINVDCPPGTRPLGGGVQASSIDTGVTINSSFPWPTGWSGIENNTSTTDATFSASVVCE